MATPVIITIDDKGDGLMSLCVWLIECKHTLQKCSNVQLIMLCKFKACWKIMLQEVKNWSVNYFKSRIWGFH